MNAPAFRRRILIQPTVGCVVADLEDDWHRMTVTVHHEDGVARKVDGEMKRWPWTSCPGATAQLAATFTDQPLIHFARRGMKSRNCTHLHDLAVIAAGHAHATEPVAYDVTVTDPVDGRRRAELVRNGTSVMVWTLGKEGFLAPADMQSHTLYTLNEWIATLDGTAQEAARILRWAAILGVGRSMDMPAGMSATAFANGSCFTFQPDMALTAVRRNDADRDFSQTGVMPLADRPYIFPDPSR